MQRQQISDTQGSLRTDIRPLRVSLPGHQGRVETHISTGPSVLGSDVFFGCHPVKGEEERS